MNEKEYPYEGYEDEITDREHCRKYYTYFSDSHKELIKVEIFRLIEELRLIKIENGLEEIVSEAVEGGFLKLWLPNNVTVEFVRDFNLLAE